MKEPQRIDGRVVFAGFIGLYLLTVFFLGLIAQVPIIDLLIAFSVAMVGMFFLYSCVRLIILTAGREVWYLSAILSGLLQFALVPLVDDKITELVIANLIGAGAAASLLSWKRGDGETPRERAA